MLDEKSHKMRNLQHTTICTLSEINASQSHVGGKD